MSQKRGGLGRNLSALLSQAAVQIESNMHVDEQAQIAYLPIMSLIPGQYQPRRTFSAETITELADSIRQQGLLQPLVVRALESDHFEIIAGERRWRACQQLGMSQVPVLIRQVNDETAIALALIENFSISIFAQFIPARNLRNGPFVRSGRRCPSIHILSRIDMPRARPSVCRSWGM